jgi:transaldolase
MASPLQSLTSTGTKLWLDSIDPEFVQKDRRLGATGATSNPIIVGDLIQSGRFDSELISMLKRGHDDNRIAWDMTDRLVAEAQQAFLPVFEETNGNDGYVSYELDPLLEDPQAGPPHDVRVRRYVELGREYSEGRRNRMIKVPATPAGLDALETLAAAGVTLNVTLIFSQRQYRIARDAIWRGAQRRKQPLSAFKSVYSIFVSRVDVYTEKHVPELSPQAQGLVGIVNAKRIWRENCAFWADKKLPLQQEMIFASTGTKKASDPPDKYVAAFAGSDIETNPPGTNDKVEAGGKSYRRAIDEMPPQSVLDEIDRKVDQVKMEKVLMEEAVQKFADPQHALLKLIAAKRASLVSRS